MEDEKIIEMFFARSEEAISALEEKYGAYCRTIAGNILKNSGDIEECLNDTYLKVWETVPPNNPERLGAYTGRIARNLALNRIRYNSAEKRGKGVPETVFSEIEEFFPSESSVEQLFDAAELTAAIEKFLYSQPKEKRDLFIRRDWYFFPLKDIAKAYGMSESKVKSMLFRMKNELRKTLEKEGINL